MATKMAGRLTVQERAQFAARYEVWNSVVAVQRLWRTVKGRNATIRQETIKNCHSKLLTTGSVMDAQRSGRPSTSRSEENVAFVRDMFTRSPHKSTWQAACESGLSRHTVCMVLKKDSNIRLQKPHYVEELTRWLGRRGPHEWPARSPDLTPCDFFLWGWVKEEVYWAKPRTMEKLEDQIWNVITNVPRDFLQKAVDSIPGRFEEAGGCRRCIHWILSYTSIFPFKKVHVKNYFCFLCVGNIEVMAISQCLLTSHPPCTRANSSSASQEIPTLHRTPTFSRAH